MQPHTSLIKEFHKEWCKASSSAGALGCLISLTRGPFPPFQRKHSSLSNTEHYTPFFLSKCRASNCLQWTMQRLQFLFSLSLSLSFSTSCHIFLLLLLFHRLSTISSPLSLSSVSLTSQVSISLRGKGAHLVTAQGNQSVDVLSITNVHSWSHFNETHPESTVNLFAPNSKTSQ